MKTKEVTVTVAKIESELELGVVLRAMPRYFYRLAAGTARERAETAQMLAEEFLSLAWHFEEKEG